jgi:hypothetical protein
VTYVISEPCIGVKDVSCTEVCPVDLQDTWPWAAELVAAFQKLKTLQAATWLTQPPATPPPSPADARPPGRDHRCPEKGPAPANVPAARVTDNAAHRIAAEQAADPSNTEGSRSHAPTERSGLGGGGRIGPLGCAGARLRVAGNLSAGASTGSSTISIVMRDRGTIVFGRSVSPRPA